MKLYAVLEEGGQYDSAWQRVVSIWDTEDLARMEISRLEQKLEFKAGFPRPDIRDIKDKEGWKRLNEFSSKTDDIMYSIEYYELNKPNE